jgi:hypothetical protein
LEITESVVLSEPEKSIATLRVKIGKPFVNG